MYIIGGIKAKDNLKIWRKFNANFWKSSSSKLLYRILRYFILIVLGYVYSISNIKVKIPNYLNATIIIITRHSHRHSPRRVLGLSHVTTKAKVILALFYQKSNQLSNCQNALDDPKIMKEHTQILIYE